MSIFAMYPMVEGGDGITSAMERFGQFFRVRTSIGPIYLRYVQRGSWWQLLVAAMEADVYHGWKEQDFVSKKIEWEKGRGEICMYLTPL